MSNNAEQTLKKLRDVYDSSDGVLPKNEIIEKLTNKIVKQKVIRTFDFDNKLLKRYLENTPLVGGVDELVNVGLGHREDFDKDADWTKERFIPDVNANWAIKTYEDKYFYTISYQKMAQALVSLNQLNSLINEITNATSQTKQITWYDRLIQYLKHDAYIEIAIDEIEGESYAITVGKRISEISKRMTLPSDKYNKAKRINATPMKKQNLIMNIGIQNEVEWETARIFNQSNITEVGKMLYADYIDFKDDKIIATLDDVNKVYIAEKYALNGTFSNVSLKYVNYYLHEEYNAIVLPWVNGIRFIKGKMLTPTEPGGETKTNKKVEELEKKITDITTQAQAANTLNANLINENKELQKQINELAKPNNNTNTTK